MLCAPVTHEMLPKVRDRHPALYFEHSRLEVDDSSIKVLAAEEGVLRVPVALLSTLFLGPGTSVTSECVRTLAKANVLVCWIGEDSVSFHAMGSTPTTDMRGAQFQCRHAMDPKKRLAVIRRMYKFRFPEEEVKDKNLKELMGMEGVRVRDFYRMCSDKYHVDWRGRRYTVGGSSMDELTNRCLTVCNHALYAMCTSAIVHSGYLPQIGFVHSSGSIPFSYDVADLYKTRVSIDTAFRAGVEMSRGYDRRTLMDMLIGAVQESGMMRNIVSDIALVLGRQDNGSSDSQ